ncbi:MAG: PQQ-dependent sugar dehydrogenase [Candidatus Manganitrophus sp.]|nr:MAG: PQQ-dependent sugar dehydrogenase [Candidatus Manganitrophus sp.]
MPRLRSEEGPPARRRFGSNRSPPGSASRSGSFTPGTGAGGSLLSSRRGRFESCKTERSARPPFSIFEIASARGERGLLGLAFHPKFEENGRLFVNYTSPTGGLHTVISEFKAGGGAADPGSERILLTIPQPFSNHNGGNIVFGPDGFLYIGMGDGGSGNDPQGNGQNLGTLLGKMLRIDVDQKASGKEYAVPPDNPFLGTSGAAPENWAYGLRNPWRFSFDSQTGLLYAGDVGQSAREEIHVIRKGETTAGIRWRGRSARRG